MKSKTLSGIKDQVMKKFVEITAVVIATIAVIVSINQGNTQKKLEIINKQPLLNIEFIKADSEIEKGFVLRNVGFGPAIIKSFRFYKNPVDYEKNISYHEWLGTNGNSRFPLQFFFRDINYLSEGYVVNTDTGSSFFLLGTTAEQFYYSVAAKYMTSVIIEIEYKSISPFDDHIYHLRFCENFIRNNIRDRNEKNLYEGK